MQENDYELLCTEFWKEFKACLRCAHLTYLTSKFLLRFFNVLFANEVLRVSAMRSSVHMFWYYLFEVFHKWSQVMRVKYLLPPTIWFSVLQSPLHQIFNRKCIQLSKIKHCMLDISLCHCCRNTALKKTKNSASVLVSWPCARWFTATWWTRTTTRNRAIVHVGNSWTLTHRHSS